MSVLLEAVRQAMEAYFGQDARRIEHARRVAGYARELLGYIDADVSLTLTAAYLHDIGIHEAERKHGSSAGIYQELEGPAVARAILENLGAAEATVAAVCEMVGAHHTPNGVDSPEFRILWDADALVNLAEVLPGRGEMEVRRVVKKCLVTEPGYRRALELFLPRSKA